MEKIEVDFEVWQILTSKRFNEQDSYNDVLRRLLELPPIKKQNQPKIPTGKPWIIKGIEIPEGTEFRTLYKGNYYYGKVENGYLVVDGINFSSPSSAAKHITKNSVNGWIFWECKLPGNDEFQIMSSLRGQIYNFSK